VPNINITWQVSDQKLHKKIHVKTHKIYESKVKLTRIIFISPEHVKISPNSQETYQEHIVIFRNFYEEIKCTGGPNSKNRGAHSEKIKKLKRKAESLGYPAQTHANRWIRISRTHQGRWIDPDPIGSRSNGLQRGALDRVRTHPVQRLI